MYRVTPGEPLKEAFPKQIPELDGVRGIAVLLVLTFHCLYAAMFPVFDPTPKVWPFLGLFFARATEFGWAGVDLFFVLSGFLVSRILLQTERGPDFFKKFYLRRILRIAPAYYVLLAVLWAIGYDRRTLLLDALFLSNFPGFFHLPWGYLILWSVSVEMHFYLLWPWLVRYSSRRSLAIIAASLVVAEPVARAFGARWGANIYALSWFRFDEFAAGALLALFVTSPKFSRARLRQIVSLCAAAGLALVLFDRQGFPLFAANLVELNLHITMMACFATAIVGFALLATGTVAGRVFRLPALVSCGHRSYALYLVQGVVFYEGWNFMTRVTHISWESLFGVFGTVLVRAVLTSAASIYLASLSYRWIESPANRLRLTRFAA